MKTLDLQNLSMQLSAALSTGDAKHLHATATDVADELAKLAAAKPVLHALWRSDGSGFVCWDGSPLVHGIPIKPLEPGQRQVPLYAAPI